MKKSSKNKILLMILALFFILGINRSYGQNLSDINQKINELKALEKIIDEKSAQLKSQQQDIVNQR
ncbi:hypothetical protein, partial [Desulfurella sp.]|uniref:hypothetical protein n=1 Tax=Desulfurella sp. TaxID=1962857 RepID=UPI0025B8227A